MLFAILSRGPSYLVNGYFLQMSDGAQAHAPSLVKPESKDLLELGAPPAQKPGGPPHVLRPRAFQSLLF